MNKKAKSTSKAQGDTGTYLNKRCIACHKPVYRQLGSYLYRHAGIVQENCFMCHISGMNKEEEGDTLNTGERFQKIIGQGYKKEFLVPMGTLTGDNRLCFNVKLSNERGKTVKSDFYLIVPSETKPEPGNIDVPPVISDIRVTDLKRGIFDEVQVSWKTDKFSDSEVHYGLTKKQRKTVSDLNLGKNHSVTLGHLKHKAKYHYTVMSADMLGNTTESDRAVFYTNEDKIGVNRSKTSMFSPKVEELVPSRVEDEIFLYIRSNQNARYMVDYLLLDSEAGGVESGDKMLSLEAVRHGAGLTSELESGIKPCEQCHKNVVDHPINVRVGGGGANSGLPLADGIKMTCVTCHSAHGGEYPYFLRMPEQKLCDSCHE